MSNGIFVPNYVISQVRVGGPPQIENPHLMIDHTPLTTMIDVFGTGQYLQWGTIFAITVITLLPDDDIGAACRRKSQDTSLFTSFLAAK